MGTSPPAFRRQKEGQCAFLVPGTFQGSLTQNHLFQLAGFGWRDRNSLPSLFPLSFLSGIPCWQLLELVTCFLLLAAPETAHCKGSKSPWPGCGPFIYNIHASLYGRGMEILSEHGFLSRKSISPGTLKLLPRGLGVQYFC